MPSVTTTVPTTLIVTTAMIGAPHTAGANVDAASPHTWRLCRV
jgi:hypothetical protein